MTRQGEEASFFTPTVIVRQPDGSLVVHAGKPISLGGDWIKIQEAAKILCVSGRTVLRMIDEGKVFGPTDWRHFGRGKVHQLRRAAVIRLATRTGE